MYRTVHCHIPTPPPYHTYRLLSEYKDIAMLLVLAFSHVPFVPVTVLLFPFF